MRTSRRADRACAVGSPSSGTGGAARPASVIGEEALDGNRATLAPRDVTGADGKAQLDATERTTHVAIARKFVIMQSAPSTPSKLDSSLKSRCVSKAFLALTTSPLARQLGSHRSRSRAEAWCLVVILEA